MARSSNLLPATLLLLALPLLVQASRTENGECPDNAGALLVYSPFQPYFSFPRFNTSRQQCWACADCTFESAGESRKQQWAATALVMGLIPLTLKDIAWPEQRLVYVTERLNIFVEILVLALGLLPTQLESKNYEATRASNGESNMIARTAWKMKKSQIVALTVTSAVGVALSYGGMAVMEIYSKRSALGCPWPIFIVCWYIVALIPASIHSFFARLRRHREARRIKKAEVAFEGEGESFRLEPISKEALREEQEARKKRSLTAIQGADEDWPVQLSWAVYYIAGTLIFTSIMAVQVIELVCWVGLGFAVSGSSKMLAFFLCLCFEKTGGRAAYKEMR